MVAILIHVGAGNARAASPNPVPAVIVAAATGSDGLKLEASEAAFARTLRIETASSTLTKVQARVTQLRDGTGVTHDVSWKLGEIGPEAQIEISATAPTTLEIRASLPALGMYSGEIVILDPSSGAERGRTKLTVVRNRPASSVELMQVDPVRGSSQVFGDSHAVVWLTVRETAGREAAIAAPSLISFTSRARGTAPAQVPCKLSSTWEVTGSERPFVLPPGATRRIRLDIAGLPGAGEYSGTVRLTEDGAQPVDRPLSLSLKDSRPVALVFILLGVIVSYCLRQYTGRGRPRLTALQRVTAMEEQLAIASAADDGVERAVIVAVRGQAARLRREIESGLEQAKLELRLNTLAQRVALLEAWITARRKLLAVESEEIRSKLKERVQTAASMLTAPDERDDLESSRMSLVGLPREIDSAIEAALKVGLEELASRLAEHGANPAAAPVRALVEAARQAGDNLQNAAHNYELARRALLDFQVAELGPRLRSAPPGVGMDAWERVRPRVEDALAIAGRTEPSASTTERCAAYERAQTLVLESALGGLRSQLRLSEQDLTDRVAAGEDVTSAREALVRAERALQAAEELRGNRQLSEATAKYEAARAELASMKAAQPQAIVRGAFSRNAPDLSPPLRMYGALPAASFNEPLPVAALCEPPQSAQAIRRRIRIADWMMNAVIFAAAAVMGLTALYENDPTWGGWGSYAVALLWGLGLHQVSFDGLTSLTTRLAGAQKAGT